VISPRRLEFSMTTLDLGLMSTNLEEERSKRFYGRMDANLAKRIFETTTDVQEPR
jgi:hypothetical protein